MPLYEYNCLDCDTIFKERRPFSQSSEAATCPSCAGQDTRKILSAVPFISGDGRASTRSADSVPLSMSGGGCGCGGACACGGH